MMIQDITLKSKSEINSPRMVSLYSTLKKRGFYSFMSSAVTLLHDFLKKKKVKYENHSVRSFEMR